MIDSVLNVMVGVIAFSLLAVCVLTPIGACAYVAIRLKSATSSETQRHTSTGGDATFTG